MSDNPGGIMGGSGLKIAGIDFPRWAIYAVAGGLVLVLLFLKNKGQTGDTEKPTVTDTGAGLLASEFDQRLREQWEAWQKWVEEFLKKGDGVLEPPGTKPPDIIPPTPRTEKCKPDEYLETDGTCHKMIAVSGCKAGEQMLSGVCVPYANNPLDTSSWTKEFSDLMTNSTKDCPYGFTRQAGACVPSLANIEMLYGYVPRENPVVTPKPLDASKCMWYLAINRHPEMDQCEEQGYYNNI